jgi:hypothetical protein
MVSTSTVIQRHRGVVLGGVLPVVIPRNTAVIGGELRTR